MAKNDPAPEPIAPDGQVTELDELRDENARLREEIEQLRADGTVSIDATDAARDQRRAVAEHERAVMARSEGARQEAELDADREARAERSRERTSHAEDRGVGGDLRPTLTTDAERDDR
jgi:hypothetical protein